MIQILVLLTLELRKFKKEVTYLATEKSIIHFDTLFCDLLAKIICKKVRKSKRGLEIGWYSVFYSLEKIDMQYKGLSNPSKLG